MARHSEGGFILEELTGVKRVTDFYHRECLVLFFEESEPVCILLIGNRVTKADEYLTEALESDEDGEWGECPEAPAVTG